MTPANAAKARSELKSAETVASVLDVLRRTMKPLGFETFAAGFLPPRSGDAPSPNGSIPRASFLLLDWPRAWLELYAREGFAADDVLIAEAYRTSDPFTWSEVRARAPGASLRVFAAAAEFGWREGLCVPVHDAAASPAERFGMISLAADGPLRWEARARAAVAAICLAAFARAKALAGLKANGVLDALSQRERQALTYVAEGLNDAEIATLMGVTRSTAHFHVEKAKKALGASTRAQAVAIALTRDLL